MKDKKEITRKEWFNPRFWISVAKVVVENARGQMENRKKRTKTISFKRKKARKEFSAVAIFLMKVALLTVLGGILLLIYSKTQGRVENKRMVAIAFIILNSLVLLVRAPRVFVTALAIIGITILAISAKILAEIAILEIGVSGHISPWVSLIISISIGVVLLYKFFYNSIREVPADPPTKGILLFLRRRQKKVLKEGWVFLPFYPIVFDFIPIDMTSVNQDLNEQLIRTADGAELEVKVSITWTPGTSMPDGIEEAKTLINFLNKGGGGRVANILQDVVLDRLRMWAFSGEEGPANWRELMGGKDLAIGILIKAVLGDEISTIPSNVPTSVLLKYFNVPQKKPSQREKRWGKLRENGGAWEGLERELAKLNPDERKALQRAVEERRDIIIKAQQGNGAFVKKSLGITINRLNIPSVILKGETAVAAEQEAKEKLERSAERLEICHVRDTAKMLEDSLEIKAEQALELVQTERKKVKKEVTERKLNISSETLQAFKEILTLVAKIIKGQVNSSP